MSRTKSSTPWLSLPFAHKPERRLLLSCTYLHEGKGARPISRYTPDRASSSSLLFAEL